MNELIIILILILLNGILAMSEIALVSARKSSLSNDIKRGSKTAKTALKLAEEPDRFLSTIQIGITVIGILTGIFSGNVLADDFAAILVNWGVSENIAHSLGQAIIVVFVTYLTLIFGELVPKRIGMSVAEKAAKVVSKPMYFLSVIASPFVWILAKSTSGIMKLLHINSQESKVTEDEIKSLIEEGTKDGEVQEVEQDIVERVFLMGDLKVSSIMTHRSDVVALDIDMTNEQIKEVVSIDAFSAYPVIDGSFDNIKGVAMLKNFVFELDREDFNISQVLVSPLAFHENMSVYKALESMREQKVSNAFIYDEFGTMQGIVTLKDILEGLVGSLDNVHEEPEIIKRQDGEGWLVDGQCPFYNFLTYFNKEDLYNPDETDYNTVGGLVLELLEHIPHSGEKMEWNDFSFEIMDMDGVRIDKILVKILKKEQPAE